MILLFFQGLVLIYSLSVLGLSLIWIKSLKNKKNIQNYTNKGDGFSIIIPVRNEEKSILRLLQSIENQIFDKSRFELIIIDDSSHDQTIKIIQDFQVNTFLNIKLLSLNAEERGHSPKKSAIKKALGYSDYPLIFCTDGDCQLPEKLLYIYSKYFSDTKIKFISGPVTFFESKNRFLDRLWNSMQIVEFASLVGVGAVSIMKGNPNMCSGANIAYRKSVFFEVGGYDGNENVASGDDEFLMHKISQKHKSGVFYSQNSDTIVLTESTDNLVEFYNQRKRWSGKWTNYIDKSPKILAVFIFLVNLTTLILLYEQLYFYLIIRWLLEGVFISLLLVFLRKKRNIFCVPMVQIIYPFYAIFFGFISILPNKTYSWKQRNLK